jgi:alpha,alpha-trehalose phosphorylase
VIAAEVGHLELAHDYIVETSLMDLRDLNRNTRDGVHIASLAGAWISLVAGLGGLRDHGGRLSFAPRLPSRIERLEFSVHWRQSRLRVVVTPDEATYSLRDGGSSLSFTHHGEALTISADTPVVRKIPALRPLTPEPHQPPGREPLRRRPA